MRVHADEALQNMADRPHAPGKSRVIGVQLDQLAGAPFYFFTSSKTVPSLLPPVYVVP
jgi:hypothetical protein